MPGTTPRPYPIVVNTGPRLDELEHHSGYRLQGRTPARALCEALGLETLPGLDASPGSDALAA